MKTRSLTLAFLALLVPSFCHAEVRLGDKVLIAFATLDEGKKLLGAQDEFVKRLTAFDRSARLKTDRAVPESEFLDFVRDSALAWSEAEEQMLDRTFIDLLPRLRPFISWLPEKVMLVKTSGREEGGATYTRGNAIFFPASDLAKSQNELKGLVCHELFHVLSRKNPALRDKLYALIGFVKCDPLVFPPALEARRITNPDAPMLEHCIKVKLDGKETWVIPILHSNSDKYDTAAGGVFLQQMVFEFLAVERDEKTTKVKPILVDGKPRLAPVESLTGYYEQIGKNTQYIIHPEEILADNFALLVQETPKVPTPDLIKKMKAALTSK